MASTLLALFRALSFLPLVVLQAMGALAGLLVYWLGAKYRTRIHENMRQAFSHQNLKPPTIMDFHAAAAAIGRQMFELPWVWFADSKNVLAKVVRVDGLSAVKKSIELKRGVILITPHLACFELIALYAASLLPVTALYRPPKRAALQPLIENGRGGRENIILAPASMGGVRQLIKALRLGQAIGVLPDQVPSRGDGEWKGFFGRPAFTMTLAARVSQTQNSDAYFVRCQRLPRGQGFIIEFRSPIEGWNAPGADRVGLINQQIEQLIMVAPWQYLWSYNRYKNPPESISS